MRLKLFEEFTGWGFMEYANDSLTYIFDEYEHHISNGVICIKVDHQSNAESYLEEIEKELEPLKKKFNFIITIFTTRGQFRQTEIRIMEVEDEWINWVNEELDKCEEVEGRWSINASSKEEYAIIDDVQGTYPVDNTLTTLFALDRMWREVDVYFVFVEKFRKMYLSNINDTTPYDTLFLHLISKKMKLNRYSIRIH